LISSWMSFESCPFA